MQQTIQNIRSTRHFLLSITEGLTNEQLNRIPDGFNNNIIWNMAHLVATTESICYRRNGQLMHISQEFFDAYKPGSKPVGDCSQEAITGIKALLLSSIGQLEADYSIGKMQAGSYETFVTRYGVTVADAGAAINFLPFHEGMHTGYIMALKKLV